MQFPAIVNLFVLFVFVVLWLFSFFVLYHLTRFGVGVFPKRLSALFLGGAVILSAAVFLSYSTLDLSTFLT